LLRSLLVGIGNAQISPSRFPPENRINHGKNRGDNIMKRNSKAQEKLVYQCNTCDFVLIRKKEDPPPSYCPNCAINHLKGKMAPVRDGRERSTEPRV